MDINKLSTGHRILGIAGIVLLVSLFLPWFGAGGTIDTEFGDITVGGTATAWQAMDLTPIVLLLLAAGAIGLAALGASGRRLDLPINPGAIVGAVALLGLLLIVIQLLSPPGDLDVRWGLFLGLIATLGILYGSYTTMQEAGVSVTDARDQAAGAVRSARDSGGSKESGGSGGGSGGSGSSSGGSSGGSSGSSSGSSSSGGSGGGSSGGS